MAVVRLLGPVDVIDSAGQVCAPGSPVRATLLALLGLDAGRVVEAERLLDVAWDGDPPASGLRALRFHISKLRADLGIDELIVTVGSGYRIDATTDIDDAEAAQAAANLSAADAANALELWRGDALSGTRPCVALEREQTRLQDLRLDLSERSGRALVAAGQAATVIGDLSRLCLDHPGREGLWAILITAHYQTGNQSEALRCYERLRLALLETSGVDPSPDLKQLYDEVLQQHERLDPPAKAPPTSSRKGNLPEPRSKLIGRDAEVKELTELVSQHRLVTLTGVGGVGKTRLAIHVAAELISEFRDGVWLAELAPVGDPASVPDAVASALGVAAQAGSSVTASVAETLAGRRLLVVLDNCEHVLDAAADLTEAILAASSTVSIIATSREGLHVRGEHLWPVPSLDVSDGAASAAVELFVVRANAVNPGFALGSGDGTAVAEICRRLDGIALAIELAAARMASMTPVDVLTRLNDRFRLLSGSRRGLERHQTLRQAVQWSYDLLTGDEQTVLGACSVFAGGFDIAAATAVCDRFDEYTMLDVLDSLVRKSLVTVSRVGALSRYGLLETIRQFAEDQHAGVAAGSASETGEMRDRHARYFAAEAIAYFDIWEGSRIRDANDWLEVEFDNLRAGFRWATDRDDLTTAAAIAAHTTMIAFAMQQFEPVGWAEELLPAAIAADLTQLPRLYTAASLCMFMYRHEDAIRYAQAALALQTNPRYQPFDIGYASFREAFSHFSAGRADRGLEIFTALAAQTGLARVLGLSGLTFLLPTVRRSSEAIAIADDAMKAARAHANPYWIAFTYVGYGRAFTETDPTRSLDILREGLAYTQKYRLPWFEALISRWSAGLEAVHGDLDQALNLFTASLDSFHQAGNKPQLAGTLVSLAVFFDQIDQPEIAATVYGTTTDYPYFHTNMIVGFAAALDHVRHTLDAETFEHCVRSGEAMNLTEAVHYAHHHMNTTRQHRR